MTIELYTDASTTVYACQKTHFRKSGLCALGVYGIPPADNPSYPNGVSPTATFAINPITPATFIRVHAPVERLQVKWSAVKEGGPPTVPNPYFFNTNYVFQDGWRSGASLMTLAGSNEHVWAMAGEYWYNLVNPEDLNSSMQLGVVPWESILQVKDAVVPNINFVNQLLERTAGTSLADTIPYIPQNPNAANAQYLDILGNLPNYKPLPLNHNP